MREGDVVFHLERLNIRIHMELGVATRVVVFADIAPLKFWEIEVNTVGNIR